LSTAALCAQVYVSGRAAQFADFAFFAAVLLVTKGLSKADREEESKLP